MMEKKGGKAKERRAPSSAKPVIRGYERLYQSGLEGAELDSMIDGSLGAPEISEGTKDKVRKGIMDRKKGKKGEKKAPKSA